MRKTKFLVAMTVCAMALTGCAGTDETQTTTATVAEKTTAEGTEPLTEPQTEDISGVTEVETEENTEEDTEAVIVESSQETGDETTKGFDDIFESTEEVFKTYQVPVEVNLHGLNFVVPDDYRCTYFDDIGPVIYMDNVFQLKILKRDRPFEDVLNDLDSIDDKAIDAGAESLIAPATMDIDGKTYAYFAVDTDGDISLAVLSEAPDPEAYIGGQFAILTDNDVNAENYIRIYASIMSNAKATDAPDSTRDEIDSQFKLITGDKRRSSTLKLDGKTVNYKVPAGFYFTNESESSDSHNQFYSSAKYDIWVSIHSTNGNPESGAEWIVDSISTYDDATKNTFTAGDKTVYVATSSFDGSEEGKVFYEFTAVCDLSDGYVLEINGTNVNVGDIPFEVIEEFFEVEEV